MTNTYGFEKSILTITNLIYLLLQEQKMRLLYRINNNIKNKQ